MVQKTITADVILVDKLDSATINKLGKNIKGKIIMEKANNTKLQSAFKPFATRYDAAALDTLPDDYMLTKSNLISSCLTFRKNTRPNCTCNQRSRRPVELFLPAATELSSLTEHQAMQKATTLPYPKW